MSKRGPSRKPSSGPLVPYHPYRRDSKLEPDASPHLPEYEHRPVASHPEEHLWRYHLSQDGGKTRSVIPFRRRSTVVRLVGNPAYSLPSPKTEGRSEWVPTYEVAPGEQESYSLTNEPLFQRRLVRPRSPSHLHSLQSYDSDYDTFSQGSTNVYEMYQSHQALVTYDPNAQVPSTPRTWPLWAEHAAQRDDDAVRRRQADLRPTQAQFDEYEPTAQYGTYPTTMVRAPQKGLYDVSPFDTSVASSSHHFLAIAPAPSPELRSRARRLIGPPLNPEYSMRPSNHHRYQPAGHNPGSHTYRSEAPTRRKSDHQRDITVAYAVTSAANHSRYIGPRARRRSLSKVTHVAPSLQLPRKNQMPRPLQRQDSQGETLGSYLSSLNLGKWSQRMPHKPLLTDSIRISQCSTIRSLLNRSLI